MELLVPVLTLVHPDSPPPSDADIEPEHLRVRLTSTRISSVTVIAVLGEVDASSSRDVTACVVTLLKGCKQLLLDLSAVQFLAIQAFSTLHEINLECAQRRIPWTLVPSAEVSRVLRLCDVTGTLPVAATATGGLNTLHHERRHLTLL
jgi:anti-anti-sigma factor